jgi:UDPglucose 6-dehydrogenase
MTKRPLTQTVVGIVGLGYVGLSAAACFVSLDIRVIGIDVDLARVELLSKGVVPIKEEGVEAALKKGLRKHLISFHGAYSELDSCGIVFLTVGTPSRPNGSIDMRYVRAASTAVGKRLNHMTGYPIVVVKSTVVPGTTKGTVLPALEAESGLKCGVGFGLVTNPEFVREGKALADMMEPDALVIGRVDSKAVLLMKKFYQRVYRRLPPVLITEAVNSEFVKYSVNSFRALQLSFINELANMCSLLDGAQVQEVVDGLMMVAKIDRRYSRAGLGFGGSCLPKDTRALIAFGRSLGVNADLLEEAIESNERQASWALEAAKVLVGPLKGKKVGVLGLTFKADTDDTRESVGLRVAKLLSKAGAMVSAYDPGYRHSGRRSPGFELVRRAGDSLKDADCCIVTNDWEEFRKMEPPDFKGSMRSPNVVDGRGIYDVAKFEKGGVSVRRIGVGSDASNRPVMARGWVSEVRS